MPSKTLVAPWTKNRGGAPPAAPALAVLLAAAAVFALGAQALAAASPGDIPAPTSFVTDLAGVIDPDSAHKLSGYLQEMEQKTGAQVLVLAVETTGDTDIEQFTRGLAEKWGLGQKGKDNGALICVAVKDRRYWVTVGYGLEGALPDSFVGRVGRTYFVPNFRRGDFGKGLVQGTIAILTRLEDEFHVTLTGMPRLETPTAAPAVRAPGCVGTALTVLFVLFIVITVLRRPSSLLWFFLGYGLGNRNRRGGGGFQGGGWGSSGGGGWGSFGGGGGGRFGGGGAGGSW